MLWLLTCRVLQSFLHLVLMTQWGKPGINYGSNSTDAALSFPGTFAQSHVANKWQSKDWKLNLLIPHPLSFLSTPLLLTTLSRIFMEATELAISWLELQLALWLLIVIIPHFNEARAGWNHLGFLTKIQIPRRQSKCAQPDLWVGVWESAISYKLLGGQGRWGRRDDSKMFVKQSKFKIDSQLILHSLPREWITQHLRSDSNATINPNSMFSHCFVH